MNLPRHYIERRSYCTGWWWGFTSGLIVGCFTTATLALLAWLINSALVLPQ